MLNVPTPTPAAPTPLTTRPETRTIELAAEADMMEPAAFLVKFS